MAGAAAPTQQSKTLGWVKLGMTEKELMDAAKAAGVELQSRVEKSNLSALIFSDGRMVSVSKGKVVGVAKSALVVPEEFQKDVKVGMNEKEAAAALAQSGVKILVRIDQGDAVVYRLDDDRRVTFLGGKVFNIWKSSPATQPAK